MNDGFARDAASRPLWRTLGTRTAFEHPASGVRRGCRIAVAFAANAFTAAGRRA
ncbi:MAG TPA: hypothetical protein VFC93_02030 [Chloroflexota bacterium]|nr:hypothetical protein [Chloroflexota bacterium]